MDKEDKAEKMRIYGREYYEKNKEEISRKAKERYLQKKEKDGKIDKLQGRPRKYKDSNDEDETKKEIAEEFRIEYYIKKIKKGKDIDIEKMSLPQKRDLAVACLRLGKERNERRREEKKARKIKDQLSNSDKENPPKIFK